MDSKLVTKAVMVLLSLGSTLVISPAKLDGWLRSEETELSGVVVLAEMASSTGVGPSVMPEEIGMPLPPVPLPPVIVDVVAVLMGIESVRRALLGNEVVASVVGEVR